jgi:DNA primase
VALIGQETIDRVRQQTGIVSLIGETVKLTLRGRSHVGLCPFHKEKTASFHVSDERGFYHCFGCGVSGDAFKFVMESEGLAFIDAVRRLAERAGIEIVETEDASELRRQAEQRRRQQELYDAMNVAAEFFERMLREHPLAGHAQAELERRGLVASSATDAIADALQAFRIGYAPYGWDTLAMQLKAAGISHQAAEKVGLLAPRKTGAGHYDRFRHRLMFAVMDLTGRVIAFSGRALSEPEPSQLTQAGIQSMGTASAEAPAKYINSPESPIYKKREAVFGLHQARQALRAKNECVLVEGNFDVVSLHARGVQNVVAPLGTAFTLEQARLIKRFVPSVTLLFDGDSAGQRAVGASREPCRAAGLSAKVASLPAGRDPDDLVRSDGPEAIQRVVGAARGLLEHLIDCVLEAGFASSDAQARVTAIRQVSELIGAEDEATRALAENHANRVAERIAARAGIADARSFQALRRAVGEGLRRADHASAEDRPRAEPPARARSRDRRSDIALEILGALLDYPELIATQEVLAGIEHVEGDVAAAIAALRHALDSGTFGSPELILAKLSPSIHPFAAARLAAPRHVRLEEARAELLENVKKLRRLELERQKTEVVEELERASREGDFDQEIALLREQMRRARERHGLEER